ncbi:MAG: PKD domain-containing protein [Rhodothermales bacterium]|nr:PKD domain-containing protein [Rhodothermales bacterium]
MTRCYFDSPLHTLYPMTRTLARAASYLILLIALTIPSRAQTGDISVRGTVTESSSSSPLARTSVTITRLVNGTPRSTLVLTNDLGQYVLNATTPVAIEDAEATLRDEYWVEPAYPNPFPAGSGTLRLRYGTPGGDRSDARFEMFDVLGRRVDSDAGLSAGIYFYRVRVGKDVSMARSLIVVGSGPIKVDLAHELGPNADAAALDRWQGKTAADAEFVVAKDGFVGVESSVTLTDGQTNTVDFELDAAPIPTASFEFSGTLKAGEPTLFDASTSAGAPGETLTYIWDFGDGIHGGNSAIAHVYGRATNYTATLTVRSPFGATASVSKTVSIAQGSAAVRTDGVLEAFVSEPDGAPIQGVTVRSEDPVRTATTDAFGKASFTNLAVGIPVRLSFAKAGFTDQFARVDIPVTATNPTRVEAVMRPRLSVFEIPDAEDGFDRFARDGVRIVMPVDGLVRADGTPATGPVTANLTPLNVVRSGEIEAFPGVFEGLQPDGNEVLLLTYGVSEYVFEQNGQELQLAPGKVATIEIPIYTAGATVGQTIPLWSMDEKLGRWVQEGEGTVVESVSSPTGHALRAVVSHFSWWNCDDFVDEGTILRTIRCEADDPLRPIDCWVASNDRVDQVDPNDGTLYEVREFVEAAGWDLIFPADRTTPVSGIALLDNGEIWRGVSVVDPSDNVSETVIRLTRTEGGGDSQQIAIPADIDAEISVPDEIDEYTFDATAGQRIFISAIGILDASFTLLDPSGTTLVGSGFGRSNRQMRVAELTEDGTYTLRVAGASFAVGRYIISVKPLGDPLSLPFRDPSESLDRDAADAFPIRVAAGSVLGVYHESPTGARMQIDICTFDGQCILERRETIALTVIPTDEEYLVVIRSVGSGPYAIRITQPTTHWDRGANHSVTIGSRDMMLVSIDANPQDIVTVEESPEVPSGLSASPYGLYPANSRLIQASPDILGWKYSQLNLEPPYFIAITASRSAPISGTYEFGYSEPEIIPLTLDPNGSVSTVGQFDVYGQRLLYSFPAVTGDGLEIVSRSSDPDFVSNLSLGLVDLAAFEVSEDGNYDFFGGEFGPSMAIRVDASAQVAAGLWSNSNQLGSFEVEVTRVTGSASIKVEGDQACAGSNATSLPAALAAVSDGGTVTLCSGNHQPRARAPMTSSGVTVEGESGGQATIVADTDRGVIMTIGGDATIRSLSVRTSGAFAFIDPVSFQDPVPSVTLEDLDFAFGAPRPGSTGGFVVGGTVRDATVRRITVTGGGKLDFSLSGSGASALIEDVETAGLVDTDGHVEVQCRSDSQSMTVRSSTFHGLTTKGCETVVIEDNEIVMDAGVRIERYGNLSLARNTLAGVENPRSIIMSSSGDATITENTISGAFFLGISDGTFLVARNRIDLAQPNRDLLLRINHLTTGAPASITVQNNIMENAGVGSGDAIIDVQNADLFESVEFYNNSVRTSALTTAGKPALRFTLRNTGFTGPLPVTFVNNILQGVGGTAMSLPAGTTVDSDYNLFFGYDTEYEGGLTSTGTNDLFEPSDPENPPPLFVNNLLELEAGSPAINAGAGSNIYPGVPVIDFDGTSRPQGGSYDMGAHEQ